jgi:hypothetical protein
MIHYFQSTQTGAPQITGLASLIAVLNACLINGFNLRTITSITRVGSVATAVADAGHGFRTGDIVQIAGATPSAYNGIVRIREITTTSFKFDVTGDPATPASGAITAKIAPLDWEQAFVATNKVAYRSKDVTSTRLFLRIDETALTGDVNYGRGTTSCLAQLWETLLDIDNGSGKSEVFWRKSSAQSAETKPWLLVGDGKRFWLCVAWSSTYPNRYVPYFFGDFSSFKAADAYRCALGGYNDLSYNFSDPATNLALDSVWSVGSTVGQSGIWLARDYVQLGAATTAVWVCGVGAAGVIGMGATSLAYPNPVDNGLYVMPLMIQEKTGPSLRGRVPGLLTPLHSIAAPEPTRLPGFMLDGNERELLILAGCAASGVARLAFDLTGPWD